jgi:transposase
MYLHFRHKLGMKIQRKNYPSDVTDQEWAFCVGYLTLMDEKAPQRVYPLREIFNALRYLIRASVPLQSE